MIGDFFDEYGGYVIIGVIIGLLIWAGVSDDRRRDAACVRMWTATRTSADTVATIAKCEMKSDETHVVPFPVYVPSGR